MGKIGVGILTVSDRCDRKEAIDESGPNLVAMIEGGIINNGEVVKRFLVPDDKSRIETVLKSWCEEKVDVILTTGGTGLSERDVTPEVTMALSEKLVPGIQQLIFKHSSELTPFAALSRGVACVVGRSLIINLPGSKKAAQECLEAVAKVIPHAVDLISEKTKNVAEVHDTLGKKKSSVVAGDIAHRKRISPYECIEVDEAQSIITDRIHLLKREKVIQYENAHGYVLAEDVIAADYLPPCDVSLVDGYAVLYSDSKCIRRVIAVSNAGDSISNVKVVAGFCARVSTGAPIPSGADAVVPVENTTVQMSVDGKTELEIQFRVLPRDVGEGIRRKGTDYKMGQKILEWGTYIDSSAMGVLAAAGVTSVRVFDKPLVGVISTGNELVNSGESLKPGKVRDSNRITLRSLLREEGFEAVDLGISVDEPDALRDSLEKGFQRADVVVTTGSMSMGERDYLKEILISDFNAEICFGRVYLKPGKPTSFAILSFNGKQKAWFGLPGNPASAYVTSQLFLLPGLKKISGISEVFPVVITATLDKPIRKEDRPHYVRGMISYNETKGTWHARVLSNQISSRIGSCVNANCLVVVPPLKSQSPKTSTDYKALIIGRVFRACQNERLAN